jgi:hypothetical protein
MPVAPTPLCAAGLAFLAALAAPVAAAQTAPEKTTIESAEFRYSVAIPSSCRHEEGPGTLDAVCSPELDAEKSAGVSTATALVLEVGVEPVPDDANKAPGDLAQRYTETQFKGELAEAICGTPDKVKIANAKQVLEDARVVYTAEVACPEIKFLGLGERRASVQVLITPGLRYRLMARALKDDFEQRKEAIDAFFASFRILPRG